MTIAFALFDTAIGRCGLVWGETGLMGSFLPALGATSLEPAIMRRFPQAVERQLVDDAALAAGLICTLAETGTADLTGIKLDMAGQGETYRQIYEIARTIAPGSTLTYGGIASRLGGAADARTVGQAMGRNPWPIIVPCHRVLGAGGRLVGFSAPGGVGTKLKLLAIEGARVGDEPGLFDDLGGLPIGVRKA